MYVKFKPKLDEPHTLTLRVSRMIPWDLRLLPLVFVSLSISAFALNATIAVVRYGFNTQPIFRNSNPKTSIGARVREFGGSSSILAFKLARFIGISALAFLAAETPLRSGIPIDNFWLQYAHTEVFVSLFCFYGGQSGRIFFFSHTARYYCFYHHGYKEPHCTITLSCWLHSESTCTVICGRLLHSTRILQMWQTAVFYGSRLQFSSSLP